MFAPTTSAKDFYRGGHANKLRKRFTIKIGLTAIVPRKGANICQRVGVAFPWSEGCREGR